MRWSIRVLWCGVLNSILYGLYVLAVGGTALSGSVDHGHMFVRLFGKHREVDARTFVMSLWWGRLWILSTIAMGIAAAVLRLSKHEKR